jgi:hypothetical protein
MGEVDGFDDLFGDITFEDAKIGLDGDPEGQKSDDTPADNEGKKSESLTDDQTATDDNKKSAEGKKIDDGDDKGKKSGETPFDKNPKWIKARAAEKAIQKIMDETGLLDLDEVKDAILSGKSLKEALGDHDLDSLKKNSTAYKEYQKRMENEPDPDADPNGVPDEKLAKALQTVEDLTAELQGIKDTARRTEEDERIFDEYSSDVDKILEIDDNISLDETETKLFKSVMGIENPSTEIDIENRTEVRTMVKNSVKGFQATLQEIKQKAIDDFSAGKSEMVVTDPKKSGDEGTPIIDKKNYDPETQTVDQVLDSGKEEMLELITQQAKQAF